MAILITEKTKIEKAVAKARELKPRVQVVGFGMFEVTGSKGEVYRVEFTNKPGFGLLGACGCRANQAGKYACYHLASVYMVYKFQVRERAAERAALDLDAENPIVTVTAPASIDTPAPQACLDCGRLDAPLSFEDRCRACQVVKDDADLFG